MHGSQEGKSRYIGPALLAVSCCRSRAAQLPLQRLVVAVSRSDPWGHLFILAV